MDLQIVTVPVTPETLRAYASVSAAIRVESRLDLRALQSPEGLRFEEVSMPEPLVLDSDGHERPVEWAGRGDLGRWMMLRAFEGAEPVGGAIIAVNPDDHWFFPDDARLAVLWDIRVAEARRGQGVGRRLLYEAGKCAAEAGCDRLAIETQDVNVAACRLYASAGAVLGEVRRGAYSNHPDEAVVLWFMGLG
jgi:GNAT superfamily N-acetyltransferase